MSRSITTTATRDIPAGVDAVFSFMDDPHNHAAVTPGLEAVRDIERLENGGKRLAYTYRMGPVGVDGEIREVVHEPNRRMRFVLRGRLTGTIDLTFEPTADGTRFTYAATYQLPGRVLAALSAPVVRRINARQLHETLETVADRFAGEQLSV